MKDDPVVKDLIAAFNGIRADVAGLQKPPSTGELVGAAALLRAWPRRKGAPPDLKNAELQKALASVLGKILTDVRLIEDYLLKRFPAAP